MVRVNNEDSSTPTVLPAQPAPTANVVTRNSLTAAIESAEFGLDDAVTPIPPRYWWLKRLAIGVGPILLALLCVRFGWGWVVQRQLDAEIATYIAAGQPVYPKDFDLPAVPEADDAAKLYLEACKELTLSQSEDRLLWDLQKTFLKYSERRDAIRALLKEHAAVLVKLRNARSRDAVDWKRRYRTPMMLTIVSPKITGLSKVRDLLRLAAFDAYRRGDIRSAFNYIRDGIALANAIDQQPSIIDHLGATATQQRSSIDVERLLPLIRVCGTIANAPSCVPRGDIMNLRDQIAGEPDPQRPLVYAVRTERAFAFDSMNEISSGNVSLAGMYNMTGRPPTASLFPRGFAFIVKPVFIADTLFAVDHLNKTAEAAREPTWPRASRLLARIAPPADFIDQWMHAASDIVEPNLDRAILLHYRTVARRRMAAVGLAIRLYELDHGKRPASLAELVPRYLDALPVDPFGDGESTFVYLPDAVWPRIYTLGPNGTDDDGELGFRKYGGVHWDHLDPAFFLDGPAPRTKEEFAKPRALHKNTVDDDR
jgi:hypothetical protein